MTQLRKHFKLSNIIFALAIAFLIYTPTRVWFLRQISFSPAIENVEERETLVNYNWQLKGLNTQDVNFEDLKNEVILVNFWATWCPPCKAEKPMFQKLYNDYGEKINFLFVTNEKWEVVKPYLNENNFNLPVYNAISTPPDNFTKTNTIPASYLIDKNGKIVMKVNGRAANWNSKKVRKVIDDLLK
ncbi:MAG TPA: TlpA disulfide reductase family protein [Flavobacteriaceae bacterium]|nr:TlpA disulfide reductase family protein [Flavobacteriaceae bacterium]